MIDNFKAVIFDHDGVIVDTEKLHGQVWQNFFDDFGIKLDKTEIDAKIRGRSAMDILNRYLGEKYSQEELKFFKIKREKTFDNSFRQDFKTVDGFSNFVKKLKANNYSLAIASSATRDKINFTLDKLNLNNFFDVIITAEQVLKSKPDPQMYNITIEKLKLDPGQCVVFEDAKSGIESASKAGSKIVLVTTTHQKNELSNYNFLADIADFKDTKLDRIFNLNK